MGGAGSRGTRVNKSSSDSSKSETCANNHTYPAEVDVFDKMPRKLFDSGPIALELKPSTPVRNRVPAAHMVPHITSFLGKAGSLGLEKAVEVLDTLGSSMTNLNSGGFNTGVTSRGNRVSILAFEIANTIAKGATLLQSLSQENVQIFEKEILHSEVVRQLVSTDMNELFSIAAADKREEFGVFAREVVRFGNLCKDPQWHNLDRLFSKLDTDPSIHKQPREEAEMTMQELTTLAQHTYELYHELHALDGFEQDYQRKLEEVGSLYLPRTGGGLAMLLSELRDQRKLVKGLKRKSLWSKSLEQVLEKLVDTVSFIHQEITVVFGNIEFLTIGNISGNKPERLGLAGLALHYANLITQISNIASRPTSLPPNTRDTLYNGLPLTVKTALRTRLQSVDTTEKFTIHQIKTEIEKTLLWLVPVATDTTKAHQGFGWVGEWASTDHDFGKKTTRHNSINRLQTLYHADKRKVEYYILELITWLNCFINLVRFGDNGLKPLLVRPPACKWSHKKNAKLKKVELSVEDRNLLDEVTKSRKVVFGLSKSQDFASVKQKKNKMLDSSRSTGSSPRKERKHPCDGADMLDVLDGFDSSFSIRKGGMRTNSSY